MAEKCLLRCMKVISSPGKAASDACGSNDGFRHSPTQRKMLEEHGSYVPEEGMSRFAVGFLVAICLTLTAYFGAAAWRASDDNQMDITGRIGPAGK
jgi:hypothetical protein